MIESNKELDEDLTMLNGAPDEAEQLATNLGDLEPEGEPVVPTVEPAEPQGSQIDFSTFEDDVTNFGPELRSQSDADEYIKGLRTQDAMSRSQAEGTRDNDLDAGKSTNESVNSVRARNQSGGIKFLKAMGGGILEGGLIALEQAGYVADLDTYTNMFGDVEDLSGNAWTRLMKDTQEDLRQSETFKIYEDDPDPNSIFSKIFKWTSLESAVSSGVGFGITGLGAAKLVSVLGATKNFAALAAATDRTLGVAGGSAKAFVGPLATSAMSNFFMGQMMATDTYNVAMEQMSHRIGEGPGQLTMLEAQKIANTEAQDVVALNMALSVTGHIKFGGIFKRRRTDILLKDPTIGRQALNLIKRGSPTAFGENVYQEMIQMEQIHDANVLAKTDNEDEYSEDYWTRVSQLMLSDRAVHAGALGVIGGPIQFALIQRPMMGKQIAQQRADYKTQQGVIKVGQELASNNFKTFSDYTKIIDKATKKGDISVAKLTEQAHLIHEVAHQIEWGTLDMLKKDIEYISTADKTDPKVATFDEGYQEKAVEFLDLINNAESYMGKNGKIPNIGGIVYNRLVSQKVDETRREVVERNIENRNKLKEVTAVKFPNVEFVDGEANFTDRVEGRFDKLSATQTTALKAKESIQDKSLIDFIQNREEYADIEKDSKRIEKFDKLSVNLYQKFKHMISEEGQAEHLRLQAKNTENYEENAKKKNETEDTIKKVKDKNSRYTTFGEMEAADVGMTAGDLEVSVKEKDAKIRENISEGKYADIREGQTFTSIDTKGKVAVYSPHDILQSEGGKFYRVDRQHDRGTKKSGMPEIQEVQLDEKGQWKVIGKLTELKRNDFLRNGVLQAMLSAKGEYRGHLKDWTAYPLIDTVLKPNHPTYNSSRVEHQKDGVVITTNVRADNIGKEGFNWLEEYRLDILSKPFVAPYDITLKLNSDYKNNSYIDVYTDVNGKQEKLTRLNRDYNLAHEDLIAGLVNGETITGTITGHYSNEGNFVKNKDENGNPIQRPLSDFKNAKSDYLINGSLILAQTKGRNKGFENEIGARAIDGRRYEGDFIPVEDGEGNIQQMQIPYESMNPGDTYALVKGLNGKVTPIALRGTNLANIDSNFGFENKTVDIMIEWQQAVDDLLQDEIANEFEYDKIDKEKAAATNKNTNRANTTSDESRAKAFRKLKRKRIFDTYDEKANTTDITPYWESFQKSVLQHLSYQSSKKITSYKEDNTPRDEQIKGKSVMNPSYFKPTIMVSQSGKYVPGLEIANPNSKFGYLELNSEDNQAEFLKALGRKRAKAPITVLTTPIENIAEAADMMENFMRNTAFTTNVDLGRIFAGASANIQLHGEDVSYGEFASKKLKVIDTAVQKKQPNVTATFTKDTSEKTLKEFNDKIDTIFEDSDNVAISIPVISTIKGEVELLTRFEQVVQSLNIQEYSEALTIIRNTMNDISGEKTDALQSIEDSLQTMPLENRENTSLIAKGILALQEIQTKVKNHEFSLVNVSKSSADSKFVQAENMKEFARHSTLWHKVHGLGTVEGTNPKTGLIRVKFNTKTISSYPADLYLKEGAFHELYKAKKKIASSNMVKDSFDYNSLQKKINTLEARASYLTRRAYGDPIKEDTGTEEEFSHNMTSVAKSLELRNVEKAFSAFAANSSRANNIAKNFDALIEIRSKIKEMADPIPIEIIKELNESWIKAVPYNQGELDVMLDLVNEKIKENQDVEANERRKGQIEFFKGLLATVEENIAVKGPVSFTKFKYDSEFLKERDVSVDIPAELIIVGNERDKKTSINSEETLLIYEDMVEELGIIIELETVLFAERFKATESPKSTPNSNNTKNPGKSSSTVVTDNVKSILDKIAKDFSKVKGLTEEGKTVSLTKDFKYYTNEDYKDSKGNYIKFGRVTDTGKNPLATNKLKTSQQIGTGSDALLRDFFDGKPMEFSDEYAMTEEAFNIASKSLNQLREDLNGQTVLAKDIVLFDPISETAGQVDLITYNAEGLVRIYDIKTMLYNPNSSSNYDSEVVWEPTKKLNTFGDPIMQKVDGQSQLSKRRQHQQQLSNYRIILNNNYGLLAEELFIIPIEVDYTVGIPVTRLFNLHKTIKISPLSSTDKLKLDTTKTKKVDKQSEPDKLVVNSDVVIRKNNMMNLSTNTKVKYEPTKTKTTDDQSKFVPEADGIMDTLMDLGVSRAIAIQAEQLQSNLDIEGLTAVIETMQEVDPEADIDSVISRAIENIVPFKLAGKEDTFDNEQFNDEVSEVQKLLPNVPIEVTKNVAYMYKTFGADALGAYNKGVSYVVQGSEAGTVFHEAFHAVSDLYLTHTEKDAIAKERGLKSWDLAFEEKLASEFEVFQKDYKKQTLTDKVKKFFASIIDWFKGRRSEDLIINTFTKIMEGGFKKSPSKVWFESSLSGIQSQEKFMAQLSDQNNVSLQELRKSNRIKIVC